MTGITSLTSTTDSHGTMPILVQAADELVKAACSHVETVALNVAKDSLESLKEIALKSSSSMEKSVGNIQDSLTENLDSMKRTLATNIESIQQSLTENAVSNKKLLSENLDLIKALTANVDSNKLLLTGNLDSIKQLDTKLNTLNNNMTSLKDELTNLSKTLEKQATTQRLQWAIAHSNDISQPFTYFSYEVQGKSLDYTKCSSSVIIREILLAFLRGEGCDISCRTISRKNREEGEKEFRETISKEIQAITGQKPRMDVAEKGYAIYYS